MDTLMAHHMGIVLLILGLTAAIAGCVDAFAGGGGLLTMPVLLSTGISPVFLLGTHKLQASAGSTTAAIHYIRNGPIHFKFYVLGVLAAGCGGVIGAYLTVKLSPEFLEHLLPVLLGIVMIYMIISPGRGLHDQKEKISPRLFFPLMGLMLGTYDGFFGPGTGSFWVVSIVGLLGYHLKKAACLGKVCNAASNLSALGFFLMTGHVLWRFGIVMALGQMVGSRCGAHFVLNKSTKWIKPVFLSLCAVMWLSLILKG